MLLDRPLLSLIVICGVALPAGRCDEPGEPGSGSAAIKFASEVRPILSDHCFACHGPDEANRQADLRLDQADGIAAVVDASDPEASEIMARVTSTDDDIVMPPPEFHKPLKPDQIQTLRDWIAGGGQSTSHWAFEPPVKTVIQSVSAASEIDMFIDRRVASAGLVPNPRADDRMLLRRLHLDLTGLPPSLETIRGYALDESPHRYEHMVDKLLDSPEFGRHVGRYWLDLVRYGDTHGLHLDNYREMWLYRDWVITAINNNMPYDKFITKQLAGDLLSDADDQDRIASGFNRLNISTSEGGSIYDEVFARNCIDRTDAFGTIFLGLTTQCAVCHDHKFDPIKQSDYYSLLAFFNSLDGKALDGNVKDHPPALRYANETQKQQRSEMQTQLTSLEIQIAGDIPTVDAAQKRWQESLHRDEDEDETVSGMLQTIVPNRVHTIDGTIATIDDQSRITLSAAKNHDTVVVETTLPGHQVWQTLRLDAFASDDAKLGTSENGNAVLSEITVEIQDVAPEEEGDAAWIEIPIEAGIADHQQAGPQFDLSKSFDGVIDDASGWALAGHQKPGNRSAWFSIPGFYTDGEQMRVRISLHFRSQYAGHLIRQFRLSVDARPPTLPEAMRLSPGPFHVIGPFPIESADAGYSRSPLPEKNEIPKFDQVVNFEDQDYHWKQRDDLTPARVHPLDQIQDRASSTMLYRTITAPLATTTELLIDTDGGTIIHLNGKEVFRRRGDNHAIDPLSQTVALPLVAGENHLLIHVIDHGGENRISHALRSIALPPPRSLAGIDADASAEDQAAAREYFRRVVCVHPDWTALTIMRSSIAKQQQRLHDSLPTTLIWKELETPRDAHVLQRGQYDAPGEIVPRDTPAFLPAFPADAPRDRLGLAMWLTDPNHPLTSRVAVNRFWQMIFGTGLVKTSEDFGNQGEMPSHPQLLDNLAVDFVADGWDVKRLIRRMVMSNAYQRDAAMTAEMVRIDPGNRLYARGPRHRLDAEILRDQALSLAGLLTACDGGPSVKPPQPTGLWEAVGYTDSDTAKFVADAGADIYRRSVYTFWKRTSAPPQLSTFDAPTRESCTARRERTNTPLQALLLMNEVQFMEAAKHLANKVNPNDGRSMDEQAHDLFETVTAIPPTAEQADAMISLLDETAAYYHAHPNLCVALVGSQDADRAAMTILASTLLNLDQVVSK